MERNSVFFVVFCCFFVSSALINKGVVNIHFCSLIPVRCTDNDPFNSIYLLFLLFFFVSNPQNRQLLKDSFMVELVEGARKLRHVFLFTDLLLCAKLKKQIAG